MRLIARTMSVDLSMTITAAVPRPDPSAFSPSKSIGASRISSAGTSGTDDPPGMTASKLLKSSAFLPPRMPPPWQQINTQKQNPNETTTTQDEKKRPDSWN